MRYSLVKVLLTVPPLRSSFSQQLPCVFTDSRFFNPLLSSSYETPLEQPLSFHIYTKRGGVGRLSAPPTAKIPRVKRTNSFIHILLRTLCRRQKTQLLCNQANPHSSCKTPGVGGPLRQTQRTLRLLTPARGSVVFYFLTSFISSTSTFNRRAQSCKISRSQIGRFGFRGCGRSVGMRPVKCRNTAAECLYAGTGSRNATFPRYCRASDSA